MDGDKKYIQKEQEQIVDSVKENSKFFKIRIIIKIFGVVVVDYTWPPKKN